MKKILASIAALVAVIPALAFAMPVFADSPGQLQSGSLTYLVKNVTQSGTYAATAAASCNDVVQFSTELTNTEFSQLNNIVVSATLTGANSNSFTSVMTAVPDSGASTGTTGTATVTSGTTGTLAYVNGSTKLYDGNGNLLNTLADGIATTAGVNAGNLAGSTTEYLNFQAKLTCQTPPTCAAGQTGTYPNCVTPVTPTCAAGQTGTYPNCVTPTPTPTPTTTLPNTGAGDVIGIAIGAIVAGTVAGRLYLSRKLSRR
ncbi:MAG: hypothetical protein WDN27_04475 [Candidatus Saccharibacteria bacterium]